MPAVSVIVPSYNLGQYLPQALDSVLCQTFQDWECLIVENGSTDGSMNVVTDYCNGDPRFIPVVFQENRGVAAARNRGLELAEGDYILFLDADDLIAPDYMASAVVALEADPALTLVYGKGERFGAETKWDLPPFSPSTMLASNCLYISCFFRRKDVMPDGTPVLPGQTGQLAVAFDPEFKTGYEDWDFWLSLMEAVPEFRVMQLPALCFRYRTRRNSRNFGVTDEAMADIRHRLWEKHKALYARYFCNPVETVEYRRLARAYKKAARMPLWRLRTALKKLLGR
jgi:glycosyltransferase involved in cell wall biosynthesis